VAASTAERAHRAAAARAASAAAAAASAAPPRPAPAIATATSLALAASRHARSDACRGEVRRPVAELGSRAGRVRLGGVGLQVRGQELGDDASRARLARKSFQNVVVRVVRSRKVPAFVFPRHRGGRAPHAELPDERAGVRRRLRVRLRADARPLEHVLAVSRPARRRRANRRARQRVHDLARIVQSFGQDGAHASFILHRDP
jgi:hypothetical protein